jgi:hypothetical protein
MQCKTSYIKWTSRNRPINRNKRWIREKMTNSRGPSKPLSCSARVKPLKAQQQMKVPKMAASNQRKRCLQWSLS